MTTRPRIEQEMVERLVAGLDDRLIAVVLHGPAAHEDTYEAIATAHLLIVLTDLEPTTLRGLGGPVRWWLRKEQPWPRLLTPALLRDIVDVWPIELLDIARHHRVLHGVDPLGEIRVDPAHLRVQCERELRERLMRLREGYVVADGRAAALRQLMALSYTSFVQVLRGCLHLLGGEVPRHDHEVVAALCARLDLDPAGFAGPERLARGDAGVELEPAFAAYYRALVVITGRIDRFVTEGSTP
jgi:hypothetical protein